VTPIATVITIREISKILKCSSVAEEIRDSNSPSKRAKWYVLQTNHYNKEVGRSGKKRKKKKKAFW